MGRFLLGYKGEYFLLECLSFYRQRDTIEKAFRALKTDLDILPLRDPKETTIRKILFIFFVPLITRPVLLMGMQSSPLNEKYSVERMLLELEKLHMIGYQKEIMKKLERRRKQNGIIDAFDQV